MIILDLFLNFSGMAITISQPDSSLNKIGPTKTTTYSTNLGQHVVEFTHPQHVAGLMTRQDRTMWASRNGSMNQGMAGHREAGELDSRSRSPKNEACWFLGMRFYM